MLAVTHCAPYRTPWSDIMARGSRVCPLISSTVYQPRVGGTDSSFTLARSHVFVTPVVSQVGQSYLIKSSRGRDPAAPGTLAKDAIKLFLLRPGSPMFAHLRRFPPLCSPSTCFVSDVCWLAAFPLRAFVYASIVRPNHLRWTINAPPFTFTFELPDFFPLQPREWCGNALRDPPRRSNCPAVITRSITEIMIMILEWARDLCRFWS